MNRGTRLIRRGGMAFVASVVATALVLFMALPAQASPGQLDPTFGTGGIVVTNPGNHGWANQLVFQADGKLLVTGFAGKAPAQDFALLRYNTDGSLDTTFGTAGTGIVLYNNGGKKDEARAIALQADGKILIAGYSGGDYAVLRFNSNGTIDTTFGNNGIRLTNIYGQDSIRAIVLLQDGTGRIVVAGWSGPFGLHDFSLARYLSNGTLDTTFGTTGTGTVRTDFGADEQARGAALQTDGKIVVGGYSKTGSGGTATFKFALARYNSAGSLDTTFGTGGEVISALNPTLSTMRAVALQTDGKIVACGYVGSTGGIVTTLGRAQIVRDPDLEAPRQGVGDFAVARYLSDGTLDPSFGTSGVGFTVTELGGADHARGCSIQPDGKVVLGGNSSDPTGVNDTFAVVRYNTDGSLDTSFGSGGIVTTDIGGNDDGARDVKIDANGNIVGVGITGSPSTGGFLMALARYLGS
jgi:uncharacterized delta-60 repeat protein